MKRRVISIGLTLVVLAAPAAAAAAETAAHALVVGVNQGGRGQAALRFAESDARRVAELLQELGGYPAANVDLVLGPSRTELERALEQLAARVTADAAAGRQPIVFFYYSGHARAAALNLGREEMALADLRARLLALSSGLTVVVLDACQSGAFSRIKGAEPAADFSYNSLANLDARGVAVLASSSASELSQESDRLHSSYFTHHLLVGLRGAGDASGDGRVSLDEAYRYAYHQTLVATTATAVGAQHVSLEVDLKGKGEVPLTTPASADARLELGADVEGEVLVERRSARSVVAELHKASGAPVTIGLPAGRYRVLVRVAKADHLRRCDVALRVGDQHRLAPDECERAPLVEATAKGGGSSWMKPRWSLELAIGGGTHREDGFISTLGDFGYTEQLSLDPQVSIAMLAAIEPRLEIVAELAGLGSELYARDADTHSDYEWKTTLFGLHGRARLPLAGGAVNPFVQAGGGVAMADARLENPGGATDKERYWGWHLGAATGVELMPWTHVGFTAVVGVNYAPVVENLIGDTHDSGGTFLRLGLRGTL